MSSRLASGQWPESWLETITRTSREARLSASIFKDSTRLLAVMYKIQETCCSSPSSIRFWFLVSVLAWGVLSVLGIYWSPLRPYSASTILLAAAVGCIANWLMNRTLHCGITAPLFLVAGTLFLLSDARIVPIEPRSVWPFVLLGVRLHFCWNGSTRSVHREGSRVIGGTSRLCSKQWSVNYILLVKVGKLASSGC
jgi:hypothetical protein